MDKKIKISVIIPTYNRPQLLVNTISSLKEQNFSDYEIIVVDNACSDDTKLLIERKKETINAEKYSIKYIQEANMGLHNARHTGAKTARGEILIFMDDDLIADKNYLLEIYKVFQKIPSAGWVGGKILPQWEVEPPKWIKHFPPSFLSLYDIGDELKEVQYIYGSIKRDHLFELGGFNPDAFGDPKMKWYRGDGEIGLLRKVRDSGKKVIYNPKAVLWHFIPKERLTVKYFKERAFKSGIEASFSKYRYGKDSFHIAKLLLRASVFGIYCIFHNILGFISSKDRIKHKVTSSHYKARSLYELRLAIDKNLQEFVRKKSWIG